jgi:hypothetical protein
MIWDTVRNIHATRQQRQGRAYSLPCSGLLDKQDQNPLEGDKVTTFTTAEEKTLPELCEMYGIELKLKRTKTPSNALQWQKEFNAWLAILSYDGYHVAVPYYTGKAVKTVTVADVIHSLASDYNIHQSCQSLKCFGDCFGWDENTASVWDVICYNAKLWEGFIPDCNLREMIGACDY